MYLLDNLIYITVGLTQIFYFTAGYMRWNDHHGYQIVHEDERKETFFFTSIVMLIVLGTFFYAHSLI